MSATVAAPEKPRRGEETREAGAVILVVIVALLLGWLLKMSVEGRATSFDALGGALTLKYPSSWVAGKAGQDPLFTVSDRGSASSVNPTFSVYVRTLPQGQKLVDAATAWTMGRGMALREFHDLGTEQVTLAGKPALRVNYAYIADPPAGSGSAALPAVVRASDTIVVLGNQYVVLSAASDAGQDRLDARLDAILASVKVTGK